MTAVITFRETYCHFYPEDRPGGLLRRIYGMILLQQLLYVITSGLIVRSSVLLCMYLTLVVAYNNICMLDFGVGWHVLWSCSFIFQ
jgi:hypothetical protein